MILIPSHKNSACIDREAGPEVGTTESRMIPNPVISRVQVIFDEAPSRFSEPFFLFCAALIVPPTAASRQVARSADLSAGTVARNPGNSTRPG